MRFLLVLLLGAFTAHADDVETALARVRAIHGAAGPWAVTGFRLGESMLATTGLPRYSFSLEVRHRAPARVQYSCIADGVQAATGASLGKLNLFHEVVAPEALETILVDRRSGRRWRYRLRPAFVASVLDVPFAEFDKAARRVLAATEAEIFEKVELAR